MLCCPWNGPTESSAVYDFKFGQTGHKNNDVKKFDVSIVQLHKT